MGLKLSEKMKPRMNCVHPWSCGVDKPFYSPYQQKDVSGCEWSTYFRDFRDFSDAGTLPGVLNLLRALAGWTSPGRKLKSAVGAGLPADNVAKLWQPTHEPGPPSGMACV